MAAKREKLIVELAALASNGDPLIFDAPNELIVGAADIEINSGDAWCCYTILVMVLNSFWINLKKTATKKEEN